MADIEYSQRTHPYYDDNNTDWNLYKNAAKGGRQFIEDNLKTHRLEDNDDFADRQERGYYLNFCDTVPSIYNSYIFRDNIERKPDEVLDPFRDNVDGKNSSINEFIKQVGYWASVYGVCHAIVDVPDPKTKKGKLTRADVKKDNIYPYASVIHPHQLRDWSVDRYGTFQWVIIEYDYLEDTDPTKEREIHTHYKLITVDSWEIVDADGNPVKFEDGSQNAGTHDLGMVPIITMYNKNTGNDKVGESMLKDIVYINILILNWCSLIDEQLSRNCFSQLVIPDRGEIANSVRGGSDNPLVTVGSSSVFTFDGESRHPPQFISPEVDTITTIWNIVTDHIKEIYRLGGLISGTGDLYAPASGRATQMGFLYTNSALAEKAQAYQTFENDLGKLVYAHSGKNQEEYESVQYPTKFDLIALSEELESSMSIMERNFSPTLNKTIQKELARKIVPLAPPSIRKDIEDEIESGDGVVDSVSAKSEDLEGLEKSGNPNLNKLSDTFRTSDKNKKEESEHRSKE